MIARFIQWRKKRKERIKIEIAKKKEAQELERRKLWTDIMRHSRVDETE